MFQKRIIQFVIALFPLVYGCTGYEKVLKSDDVNLKYEKAFEFYNKEDYARSAGIFEQLVPLLRGTNRSDTVGYYLAKSYYGQKDYILAGYQFKTFASIFGNSIFAEEAEFMAAYCHYKSSPRPNLDQTETVSAIEGFQLFIVRRPNSPRVEESKALIIELRDKLVNKAYLNAKLYYDLGDYKASIIALNNNLNTYPDTKYREELMFLILKSNFLLAENSVEKKKKERYQAALDEYYSFISEFPDSKYMKDAVKIYNSTVGQLNTKDIEVNVY